MLLPFARGLPSPSSENGKKTGYLSDGGSHVSSDSDVSLLAAQEGDWRPGPSGHLGSAAGGCVSPFWRREGSVDALVGSPWGGPLTPRPTLSLPLGVRSLSEGQGTWASCVASVGDGPLARRSHSFTAAEPSSGQHLCVS